MNREELAWAAGLFDGEGCFMNVAHPGSPMRPEGYVYARVVVGQTHPEVLYRFQAAIGGLGVVRGPYPPTHEGKRDRWHFGAAKFEHVQAIVCLLWPWLGTVKREQGLKMLRGSHETMTRVKISGRRPSLSARR